MVIDADGHFFESEEIFDRYMEPGLRNYRPRLLSDITRVISDQHVNILSASVTTGGDRVARSRFTFEMGDAKHLDHVMSAVRNIDGVFDAFRITQ